jgi:hypothetical protein
MQLANRIQSGGGDENQSRVKEVILQVLQAFSMFSM